MNKEVLEFLHDATVISVALRLDAEERRYFELVLVCDSDPGDSAWAGRQVLVRLHDLIVANFFVFGAIVGEEQVDDWSEQVSGQMRDQLERLLSRGGGGGANESFHVSFHSGSVLEGFCRRISCELHGDEVPRS